ncbi:putative alpha/Beta hydrolase [Septoria linicola]|nr:putative alpha/Beta hydrolase [Septoria linicola]
MGYWVLGQSWGGMLAARFAASSQRSRGLKRLILGSALADVDLNIGGIQLIREQSPAETQAALKEAEQLGTFDGPACKAAQAHFSNTHVCRASSSASCVPSEDLLASMKNLQEARTIYRTM